MRTVDEDELGGPEVASESYNLGYGEGFSAGQIKVSEAYQNGFEAGTEKDKPYFGSVLDEKYREGFEAGKVWKAQTREDLIAEHEAGPPSDEVKEASSRWYDYGYTQGHRAGMSNKKGDSDWGCFQDIYDDGKKNGYDEGYAAGNVNKEVEQKVWLDMGEDYKHGERYHFMEEIAIAEMLLADDLFICLGMKGYEATELMVNANDVFAWACGDSEPLPAYSIEDYYTNVFKSNERFVGMKWVCKHRGLKPQSPIVRDMKLAGVWDDEMEALKDNSQ